MLVIGGKLVPTPNYKSYNWHDDPSFRIKLGEDGDARGDQRVNMVVIHTTEGVVANYLPGFKPDSKGAQLYIKSWRGSKKEAAAHLLVGQDKAVYQIADLQTEMAWHVPGVNRVSVGIEIVQIKKVIYEGQLDTLADLCWDLAEHLGIQPMIHLPYTNGRPVERIGQGKFYGFFGHRDGRHDRGRGDPGDEALAKLRDRGFEVFDVSKGDDVTTWKRRQEQLGLPADGVPGKNTHAALKAAGYRSGLWVLGR